jgi:tRNA nucleotidyltransferase (CCA-adding enzyme)
LGSRFNVGIILIFNIDGKPFMNDGYQVYLVGGAVRDNLLGLPVVERDYVVVGANFEEMQALGYICVGKDFPVFLHPKTREEYALARLERKVSQGHNGFSFTTNKTVSLVDDLKRRDLTINAMALDEHGNLIDPYGGKRDLEQRILRHVSDAFTEDPLRVLRLARFAARYHHLGFTIASETLALARHMVTAHELDFLVPERIWREWQLSLIEDNPWVFIEVLRQVGALESILPEIHALFGVPASVKHHKEIDTGVHTLMVLKEITKLSDNPVWRFAALVHDLGKACSSIDNWPKHANHEILGLKPLANLCKRLKLPKEYQKLAKLAILLHTKIYKIRELTSLEIVEVLHKLKAFSHDSSFAAILTITEADFLGRKGIEEEVFTQGHLWRLSHAACVNTQAQDFSQQGYSGADLGSKIMQERVKSIQILKDTGII